MEDLSEIEKIIELDIESELKPQPEHLCQIFEAVVNTDRVDEKTLQKYFYKTEPSLEDITRALEMLVESQSAEISEENREKIKRGLSIISPELAPVVPEEELHKIYDRLVQLLEHPESKKGSDNIEKIILNSLFILVGGTVAALTLPHFLKEREKYAELAEKATEWLKGLFNSTD